MLKRTVNTVSASGASQKADLNDLRELSRMSSFFQAENEVLRDKLSALQREMEGIDAATAASYTTVKTFQDESALCWQSISAFEKQKGVLMDTINDLRLKASASRNEEASSSALLTAMRDDLADLNHERGSILRKLKELKAGIQRIELDKERIAPYGKQQDDMLKKAFMLLKEAQDRMELSIVLKK